LVVEKQRALRPKPQRPLLCLAQSLKPGA